MTRAKIDSMKLAGSKRKMWLNMDSSNIWKWLTHESGFAYSEGGVPIDKNGEYPDLYAAFDGIDMLSDADALEGEETLLSELNAESELNFNAGGNTKVQEIIEHGFNHDKSFDDIMADWNEAWSEAQAALNVEVK